MCKNEYEKMSVSSKRIMLFCHLKEKETNELLRICTSQKYCGEKEKYIATNQRVNCKYYE
jgi:hypothetical protein